MTTERASISESTGRWILFATILASSMAFIDGTALNVALPALQRDLGASGTDLLWIVNGYLLFLSALLLIGGALGDAYGRKRVFMGGIALFAGASLACGLAPNALSLIAARAVQGIGAAFMVPGSLSIISASFQDRQRGEAIGTWSAFSTITTVIGPLLGGFLASAGLWRGVFFVNLPLAALALVALHWKVPESRGDAQPASLDWWGTGLVAVGLGALTYGFIAASERGFADPLAGGSLLLGSVLLATFVWVESRVERPLVPLRLFQSRVFSSTNLVTLFLYAALTAITFFLPLNLVQVQGYEAREAGLAMVPFALLLALLSRWSGRYADQHGPRGPLILGPLVTGIGFALLAGPGTTQGVSAFWRTFLPGIVAMGVGMGITVAPLTTAVMGAVSERQSGVASGVNNAVSRTAGVLAIAVLGVIALSTFDGALMHRVAALDLSPPARQALAVEAQKFGDAQVPESVDPARAPAVRQAIDLAFVDAFRRVALLCAALAGLSVVVAWIGLARQGSPGGG